MKSTPRGPEGITHILDKLDDETAVRVQHVYKVALEIVPQLELVQIIDNGAGASSFLAGELGIADSTLRIGTQTDQYRQFFSGPGRERFAPIFDAFDSRGVQPTVGHILGAIVGHELGHGAAFQKEIEESDDSPRDASWMHYMKHFAAMDSLPLGQSCSAAITMWDNDLDGFRTKQLAQGITYADWQDQLTQNARAYSATKPEFEADQFAIRIIRQLY